MLVATTVIEVGVDVPKRRSWWSRCRAFGLAHFTSCAGVGRGSGKSTCLLIRGQR